MFLAFEYVSFTTHIINIPGSRPTPSCIVPGDFNNDHHQDLVFVSAGNSALGVFLEYGNGSFHPLLSYSIGDCNDKNYLNSFVIKNFHKKIIWERTNSFFGKMI